MPKTKKSKPQHTPGPWEAKEMGPKYGGWSIEHTIHIEAGKSCDAMTGRDLPAHDVHPRLARVLSGMGADSHAESKANACLIAAAPELLEAAQALNDALFVVRFEQDAPVRTAILNLRAAIAKADQR